MKTRIIHTRIWQDNWFVELSRSSKLIFIYLITCESNNICGIFELPDRNIIFDTGISQTELEQAKQDLKEKVIFYDGWIKILNTEKYNNYVTNPKLEKAYNRELSVIPNKIIEYIDKYDTSIDTSIHTTNNHKSKIINQKQDTSINSLTDEVVKEIANQYSVNPKSVMSIRDDLVGWCKAKGKTYKDYKSALQNWVRRELKSGNIKKIEKAPEYDVPQISEEQRLENLKRIQEIKSKFLK